MSLNTLHLIINNLNIDGVVFFFLQVFEVPSGKPLVTLLGHTKTVLHCQFSQNGQTLITSSEDTTIRVCISSPFTVSSFLLCSVFIFCLVFLFVFIPFITPFFILTTFSCLIRGVFHYLLPQLVSHFSSLLSISLLPYTSTGVKLPALLNHSSSLCFMSTWCFHRTLPVTLYQLLSASSPFHSLSPTSFSSFLLL